MKMSQFNIFLIKNISMLKSSIIGRNTGHSASYVISMDVCYSSSFIL